MLRPELLVNLPKETLDQCQFSRFELLLTLTGCPCQGRYPLVDVLLDDTVIFTGHVDRERLHFNRQVIDVDSIILSIRYKGKTIETQQLIITETLLKTSASILRVL